LKQRLREDILESIRQLDEEYHSVSAVCDIMVEKARRSETTGDPASSDRKKKPSSVTGPFLVSSLDDDAMLQDWAYFKQLSGTAKRRFECLS
jgi:hypothetical protein